MKRNSLLFLLLMVLFAPLALNAQNQAKTLLQAVASNEQIVCDVSQTREAGWLQYDDGVCTNNYGVGANDSWTYGAMYPSSMLDDNNTLTKVAFYQTNQMTGDVIFSIYAGGDSAPGTLLYEQAVPVEGSAGMHEIDLTDAVTIDPEQNLWIITTVIATGNYVFPVCASSESNNDWFLYNGSWYHWNTLVGLSGKGWMIRGYVEYTEPASCPKPTQFTVSDITTSTAVLSWNSSDDITAWQIAYSDDDVDPDDLTPINVNAKTYTLTNLGDDITYYAYVRANCGSDGYSEWNITTFTTPSLCDAPFNLEVDDITYHSAELSWEGWQDSYNLQYRPATFSADFSDGIPEDWTTNDADGDGYSWQEGVAGVGVSSASYINNVGALNPDNWLITNLLATNGTLCITAYGQDASYSNEHFAVYYSANSTDPANFTKISDEFVTTGNPTVYSVDLSNVGNTGYLAIRHYNVTDMYWLVVTSFDIFDSGETVTVSNVTSPYSLEDLTEETAYLVQIQGNCPGGQTEWSDIFFTTGVGNVFINDGDWDDASNWKNNVVPEDGADVVINAYAIIPSGYIAVAGNVTIGEGSLYIEDGGQLIHTNEGVIATVEKAITGYGSTGTIEDGHYYLLSAPIADYIDPEETGLIDGEYDFYDFWGELDGEEWQNYKVNPFDMYQGFGYLYANLENVYPEFTGELVPIPEDGYIYPITLSLLPYTTEDHLFGNWWLVGNPHPCDAYIIMCDYNNGYSITSDYTDFYKMNDAGDEIIASTGAVAPMEGVFVIAQSENNIVVSSKTPYRSSYLNLNLSHGNRVIDAARIRFAEGNGMEKFQLNQSHTKLYIPQDGKDYSVVCGSEMGEMPVNFKAEKDGTYTISFAAEEIELSYLHLIDNMTGADIDLLANPSYSFDAKTSDYASRFRLVFATGNANESSNFAFVSNGNIIVNGEGTLQVIDVMGRVISTSQVSGMSSVNVNAAGVYVLQLTNGNETKIQKIVVK